MPACLPSPVRTACLPTSWYNRKTAGNLDVSRPCPGWIAIRTGLTSGQSGVVAFDGVLWHGRCFNADINLTGFYGFSTGLCSSTPFFIGTSTLFIDVWGMYRAGLWTSSIAFPVSHWAQRTPVTAVGIIVGIADDPTSRCIQTQTIVSTAKPWATACGVFNSAFTVTVFDNGTFTVA